MFAAGLQQAAGPRYGQLPWPTPGFAKRRKILWFIVRPSALDPVK